MPSQSSGWVRQEVAGGDRVLGLQADVRRVPVSLKWENMVQEVRIKVVTYNRLMDMEAGVV